MASTFGSAAACSMKRCTLVENEWYGWCTRMSPSRSRAKTLRGVSPSAKLRVGRRHERRVLQVRAVHLVVDLPQRGQVEQARHPQHVVGVHVQLADQQLQHVVGDRGGDLQPHRRAEPAPGQLPLQRLQQVLVAVLVDLELGVAGHPEQVVLDHLHAGEELAQVRGDQLLDRQEPHRAHAVAAWCGPARTKRGTLLGTLIRANSSGPPSRVADHDGQVERQAGDVGERVRRVDRQRASAPGRSARGSTLRSRSRSAGVELAPAHDLDVLLGQRRARSPRRSSRACRATSSAVRSAISSSCSAAAAGQPGARTGRPVCSRRFRPGDPHHVELVEVAGEDGEELGPLQQRRAGVLGQRQHPGVEVEPGQLPVEEPVLGQRRRRTARPLGPVGRRGPPR